ncbi:PREDICTED: 7-deoxyloganetin glucosyltransferase-like isoform X2 [Ipomoea nil]|uniref:7-deoxyloganetin glucosyltransferase-like isoform X2 n=1 Tax=Ipomoea nil TaxID=35883 RepID=UPI000900CA61|nr:PREDICTED: 7-deoxyloganetin glucosyltransferase-like isoform X2 [Ipomoea nil]
MEAQRPHAVCIPAPGQGHISAMLKLAKLLHHKGFHITYVLTQLNYTHIMQARDFRPLNQAPTFCFETIPDGIPSRETRNSAIDLVEIIFSISKNCSAPFRALIHKLNVASDVPPVSCIVSDAFMSSTTIGAAQELGIPAVVFWPFSGVGSMLHLHSLILRDKVSINNDDYIIDWIPGVKSIRLGDIPTSAWSPNPNDPIVDNTISQVSGSYNASAVIFHTFDELEPQVCNALRSMFNRAYTIGPIPLLLKGFPESDEINQIECHMWKQDQDCFQWLNSKTPKSVVYVNFGSMAVTSPDKLVELAIGLCKSMQNFLWIIRPELISGNWSEILPPQFMDAIKGGRRGYVSHWCDQEQVLNHPSVGGFLTHCGWNSIVESMSAGVAMICWSSFAEQGLNRLCCCSEWGFGLEIELDVNGENVESVVRELMEGEKGREVKKKAFLWKERAEAAIGVGGSSFSNLDKLIGEVLLSGCRQFKN